MLAIRAVCLCVGQWQTRHQLSSVRLVRHDWNRVLVVYVTLLHTLPRISQLSINQASYSITYTPLFDNTKVPSDQGESRSDALFQFKSIFHRELSPSIVISTDIPLESYYSNAKIG
jgi:hypothetical protein